MSFILDALRKSENERQRNTTPGLASAPVRQTSEKRSPWIPLVAVLLGVNLSLLAVLWYTADEPDSAELGAPQATADLIPPDPIPVDTTANMPPDLPIADPTVSRELSTELDPPPVSTRSIPSAAAVEAPPASQPAAPAAAADNGADAGVIQVPTLAELVLDGTVSLPTLHLDIHVYSKTPAERFVFINTAKYREGERISEGPVVDEINQTGVVLQHQNRRFLLTRE